MKGWRKEHLTWGINYLKQKSYFNQKKIPVVRFTCISVRFVSKEKTNLKKRWQNHLNSVSCWECSFRNCYGSWLNIYDHLDYDSTKDLIQSILRKDDAIYYLSDFGSLILIQIIPKEHTKYETFIFVYMQKLGYYIHHSEHDEMREISAKLLKIIITLSGTQLILKQ